MIGIALVERSVSHILREEKNFRRRNAFFVIFNETFCRVSRHDGFRNAVKNSWIYGGI